MRFIQIITSIVCIVGKIHIFERNTGEKLEFNIYSNMKWKKNFKINDTKNIILIPIQYNQSIFDYCNLNIYNPIEIKPLLNIFNKQNIDIEKWIAVVDMYTLVNNCNNNNRFILNWTSKYIYYIQQLGAIMLLSNSGIENKYSLGFPIKLPGNVDNFVDNYPIDILNTVIRKNNLEEILKINKYYSILDNSSIENDENPFWEIIENKYTIFIYFIIVLVLIPIITIYTSIEPIGWFNIHIFLSVRILSSLQIPIGIFCKFTILFVWSDLLKIMSLAIREKKKLDSLSIYYL